MSAPSGRFVAFLGSINVGGHRATKDELRATFGSLGHTGVETFLASGNVIFDAAAGASESRLSNEAEGALADALGFEVPVYLRSAAEARPIASREPFAAGELAASTGKPQEKFLG